MSRPKKPVIALIYDFDGTLAPGNMQDHSFIPAIGKSAKKFWENVKNRARTYEMSEILAYMSLMLEAKKADLKRKAFNDHGRNIKLFTGLKVDTGVPDYFDNIHKYVEDKDMKVKHYIISSGLLEILEGVSIFKKFAQVYASRFMYNASEVATWPAIAIDYTNKTQFLFRINKGIENSWDNSKINQYTSDTDRPVPFSRMIYIGDGETDVPAMKMVKHKGGHAIAVYPPRKNRRTCEKLLSDGRVNFIAPADYSDNQRLSAIIKRIIDKISVDSKLMSYMKSTQI